MGKSDPFRVVILLPGKIFLLFRPRSLLLERTWVFPRKVLVFIFCFKTVL
jgi:hypothetical protein